jgi:hypothetical protein
MTALLQVLGYAGFSGRDLITFAGTAVMLVLAIWAFLVPARR